MSMVTTCPNCATSFNAEPEVLLARNGRVRCGKCKQIFDGLLHLTSLEALQATVGMKADAAAEQPTDVSPTPAPADYWPPLPDAPDTPVPPMPLEIVAAAQPEYVAPASDKPVATAVASSASVTVPAAWATQEAPDAPVLADEHDEHDGPPVRVHRGWAMATTAVVLLLVGQVSYQYRSELAVHVPILKPALTQVCAWVGCVVPPLQQPAMLLPSAQPTALHIEASDLQIIDKAVPHRVQLTATLRNYAATELGFPALDLALNDPRGHVVARRVFVPREYLPAADAPTAVLAPSAEATVRVDMDISGLSAEGFRLTLMPAPTQ